VFVTGMDYGVIKYGVGGLGIIVVGEISFG
jgi:hypothetical protein